jgi:hypothetical protein
VHRELVILRPGHHQLVKNLRSKKHARAALALLERDDSVRAEPTRLRLGQRLELDDEIYRLGKRIEPMLVESQTSLTRIPGVGTFVAAKILGYWATSAMSAESDQRPLSPRLPALLLSRLPPANEPVIG